MPLKSDQSKTAVATRGVVTGVVMVSGCATYEAVTEAPASFWITLEAIVLALVQDIASIVGFLL